MRLHAVVPLLLLAGALLATGAGWWTRRPRLTAMIALLMLTATGLLGALARESSTGRGWTTTLTVLAGLLAVTGGGPLTTAVFQLVDGAHENEDSSVRSAGAVLRGGAWIGALERTAVYATMVAGWPEGLAIVLGLKGLGRYPELGNQVHTGTAERFIIGTSTSVLWAVACAGTLHLLR